MAAEKKKRPKTKKTNGEQVEYDKVISMRLSQQEVVWLEGLTVEHQRKHGLKPNQSEIVRMLIRKAASAAGLQGA